jgi:phosphatidylserine decarboxylase
MKHAGKATRAALKLLYWTLFLLVALMLAGVLAQLLGGVIVQVAGVLVGFWLVFGLFTLYFFRDPERLIPPAADAIVSPGQGKVDVIDEVTEPAFMGGTCRRVSMFLSLFDVHVQRSPVRARVALRQSTPGQFLNAMRADSAAHNENVLLGFESLERPGERIAVRLIAGLVARRIVVWPALGEEVERGERVSLIQFGSRVDVYLPPNVRVQVKVGDHVRAGATVLATRS